MLEEARTLLEDLTRVHPDVPQFLRHLAASQNDMGILLSETGNPAEAMASYHAALAIQQKLADANATASCYNAFWG